MKHKTIETDNYLLHEYDFIIVFFYKFLKTKYAIILCFWIKIGKSNLF